MRRSVSVNWSFAGGRNRQSGDEMLPKIETGARMAQTF